MPPSPPPTKPVAPHFQLRRPPADPDKPPCPYRTGFTVYIKSHIAVVDGRGPVGDTSFQAVAKIYDPLYYSFSHKDVSSVPCDVTRFADQDYSREAAAYEHLDAVGQAGSIAPKYFGSWTFNIGLHIGKNTSPQSRQIRLVLIEYLPGKSIRELCAGPVPAAAAFDEAYRLEILARTLDAEANLRFKGINHNELAARKVILHAPPTPQGQMAAQPSTIPRVVLIDYNSSVIYARTIYKIGPYDNTTLPPNPMRTHWKNSLQDFYGWIPVTWETKSKLRQERLRKCFGGDHLASGSSEARYETLKLPSRAVERQGLVPPCPLSI
ncbi:hypothetical protein P885DRAFT_59752 [Corynascus similis CBS 632.67]